MVFSSTVFLVWFLPITLILYYILPRQLKNYFLLVVSLFFYAWGAPKFTIILITSIIVDFYLVKAMVLTSSERKKKFILGLSIGLSLSFLLYYKYANFFIENTNVVLMKYFSKELSWAEVLLPIGISFFTFQKITYSIDIYRGKTIQAKNAAYYLLYVVMFPQLIAGPIVRYNTIAKQLNERDEKTIDRINGFIRFSIGLAKKVLLANTLGEYADDIFDNSFDFISSKTAWLALLSYTFQIYYDFSGYSDMAIGLGRMLGFTFPENFDSPYTSRSITEFWRRWHITLGHWMRDYLYIPLGGNRVKTKIRLYSNLWLVFLISGLWHGASWNFVLWGAYHGLFLALDRMFLLKFLNRVGKFWSWIITFIIVVFGWVFFRIEDFNQSITFISKLIPHYSKNETSVYSFGLFLVLGISFVFSISSGFSLGKRIEIAFFRGCRKSINTAFILVAAIFLYVLSLAIIVGSDYNPFIYFRF